MFSIRSSRAPARVARARAVAASLAALACGALTAVPAHAGTYAMYACDVPGINLSAPSRAAWTTYDTSGQVQQHEDCTARGKGGSISFQINYPTGILVQNTGIGLEVEIPSEGPLSNVSIARVTDWSTSALTAQNLRGVQEAPAIGLNLQGPDGAYLPPPGHDSSGWTGFSTSGPGHDSGPLPSGTKSRRLGVFCAHYGYDYGHCTLPTPFLRVRGIRTLLDESVQPTGAITGGSLTFDGAQKGVRTLSHASADAESGVERVDVTLDGTVVATKSLRRDLTLPVEAQSGECTYDGLRACPATHTGLLSVDTTRVPDGAYELGLRVTDAAGNSHTTIASRPVVVDNIVDEPAPAGPTPIPLPGPPGANGANGSNGTNGANGTTITINGANGSPSASLKAAFAGTQRGTIRSAYGKRVLIVGRLVAPNGRPITGARVWVMRQDKTFGATMKPAGEVVTDGNGTFRYVTTATRSRTVRFGYRAHIEDTAFSSTTDVGIGVIADLRLSTDRRSLRNGQALVFRGSVTGAPKQLRKVIELQVKKGSRWMTFRSTRLRNGRFSERYRFTRTHGSVTYVFRARVRQEVGFPFLTSHSHTAKVTVRG